MRLPTEDYRRTAVVVPDKLLEWPDATVHRWVGRYRRRFTLTWGLARRARRVRAACEVIKDLSDARLKELLEDHRAHFRRHPRPEHARVDQAMAAVAQASVRTLGMLPHTVQLMGALAMHDGYLIEMATGEGKSLTASLSSVLAGWSGKPSHVITVNEYLAARDAEELSPLYKKCGVSVTSVVAGLEPPEARLRYEHDVVYTTSHQLLADFLRDRLVLGAMQNGSRRMIRGMLGGELPGLVLRGVHTALVDEADSVLIDEAVTPLIISHKSENRPLVEASHDAARLAAELVRGDDYKIDERYRELEITDGGREKIEASSHRMGGIWRGSPRRVELITQALIAREHYLRDKQYVVDDGKVVIVDEYTGRLMPDRTWSHGLHQAVEAKEGIEVTSPSETLARLSFQRFFRLFRRMCGMSGTIKEVSDELWYIYEQPVLPIPTHKPCKRKEMGDAVYPDAATKLDAIVAEVKRLHALGRPVLLGTRNVRASEELAGKLTTANLEYQLLNAVRHKEEAQIVAGAGQRGRITIATNMAGRGTDIKLGPGVEELGGLHVIAAERNESRRIDRQLFGRSARQGDPGSAQAFVCPDDELIQRFVPYHARQALRAGIRMHLPGAGVALELAMSRAQAVAQRDAYRARTSVLQMDEWLEDALSFTDRSRTIEGS